MGNLKKVEFGTYTPTEDVFAKDAHIPHGLGATPNFIVVMSDAFAASTDYAKKYVSNSSCVKSLLQASNKAGDGICAYLRTFPNHDAMQMLVENINYAKFLHADAFEIPYYNSDDYLKADVTYHYVVGILE